MPIVRFLPDDVGVEVDEGENLLRAAMRAGVHINASCGGEGVCGKCRVILESGELESPKTQFINQSDYDSGYRQACKAWIKEDVVLRVPVESQFSAKGLERIRPGGNAARMAQEVGVERLLAENKFDPPYIKRLVKVKPPDRGDNITDLKRVVNALRLEYDIHNMEVDFQAIKTMPSVVREGNFETTVTLAYPPSYVEDPKAARIHMTDIQAGDCVANHFGLAVDIGTTTVWVELIDMNTGRVLATAADFNHQLSYGEDVISRIVYAGKPDGLERMQNQVVGTINALIDKVVKKRKIDREDITVITVAGNTTMTQLFLAVDPKFIRLAPYVPTANYYPPVRAVDLDLNVGQHVKVNVFPAVSSYVGGDIIAGILANGMYQDPRLTLYIDLGTNGEIVVGNQDWMACASCSAGPAFEGGGVKFGMRAVSGAIEDFALNPETMEPMLLTVDMKKPMGICGSGLINTVAGLFEMGVIDERGKYEQDLSSDRVRPGEDGWEYVLSWADDNQVGRDITLTEVDIDNLIRAKAAMYAGFQTLLEGVGLEVGDLERVIIAGGFGKYINLERSIMVGLLPELDLDRFSFIGNGSLQGARLAGLSNSLRQEVKEIEKKVTNFELSEVPAYMEYYVSCQFLPHTDRDKFPGVIDRVGRTRGLAKKG